MSTTASILLQMGQMDHMYEIVCNIEGSYHNSLEKYHLSSNQFFKLVEDISTRIKGRLEYWKDKQFQLDEIKRFRLSFWKRVNIFSNIFSSILFVIVILCLIVAMTVALISYLSLPVDQHVPHWMLVTLIFLSICTCILLTWCCSSWIGGSIFLYLINIKWYPHHAKEIRTEIQTILKEETDRIYSQYPGIHIQLPFSKSSQTSHYTTLQQDEETQQFLYQEENNSISSSSQIRISLY